MQIKRDGRTQTWSATTHDTTYQAPTLGALVSLLEKAGEKAPCKLH